VSHHLYIIKQINLSEQAPPNTCRSAGPQLASKDALCIPRFKVTGLNPSFSLFLCVKLVGKGMGDRNLGRWFQCRRKSGCLQSLRGSNNIADFSDLVDGMNLS
jgi:hypothetical protein